MQMVRRNDKLDVLCLTILQCADTILATDYNLNDEQVAKLWAPYVGRCLLRHHEFTEKPKESF